MIISRKDYEAALRRAKAEGRMEERRAAEGERKLEDVSRYINDDIARIYRDMDEIKGVVFRVERAMKNTRETSEKPACTCSVNG